MDNWNIKLQDVDERCFAHLFYYPQEEDQKGLIYLYSTSCKWSQFVQIIRNTLSAKNLGKFGASVSIMNKEKEIPKLLGLDYYFSSDASFANARKVMIIVISSFDESNNNNNFDNI